MNIGEAEGGKGTDSMFISPIIRSFIQSRPEGLILQKEGGY